MATRSFRVAAGAAFFNPPALPVLLHRESTDAAAVRGDGAQDCRFTGGDRVDGCW